MTFAKGGTGGLQNEIQIFKKIVKLKGKKMHTTNYQIKPEKGTGND